MFPVTFQGQCTHIPPVTSITDRHSNANKLIAIPLCHKALDYCTSTQTEKSSLVNFFRIALFITGGAAAGKGDENEPVCQN